MANYFHGNTTEYLCYHLTKKKIGYTTVLQEICSMNGSMGDDGDSVKINFYFFSWTHFIDSNVGAIYL